MFGNRGAMVHHEGASTARVAAGLPLAGVNRRLSRSERASESDAKRKHAEARKHGVGNSSSAGTIQPQETTAEATAGRAWTGGGAKRPRIHRHKAELSVAGGKTSAAFVVERLCGQRVVDVGAGGGRKLQYLVRWSGFGAKEDSWEEQADILDAGIVRAFLKDCDRLRTPLTPPLLNNSIDFK